MWVKVVGRVFQEKCLEGSDLTSPHFQLQFISLLPDWSNAWRCGSHVVITGTNVTLKMTEQGGGAGSLMTLWSLCSGCMHLWTGNQNNTSIPFSYLEPKHKCYPKVIDELFFLIQKNATPSPFRENWYACVCSCGAPFIGTYCLIFYLFHFGSSDKIF